MMFQQIGYESAGCEHDLWLQICELYPGTCDSKGIFLEF